MLPNPRRWVLGDHTIPCKTRGFLNPNNHLVASSCPGFVTLHHVVSDLVVNISSTRQQDVPEERLAAAALTSGPKYSCLSVFPERVRFGQGQDPSNRPNYSHRGVPWEMEDDRCCRDTWLRPVRAAPLRLRLKRAHIALLRVCGACWPWLVTLVVGQR